MKLIEIDRAALAREAQSNLASISTPEQLEAFRREWLGKDGKLKSLLRDLRDIDPEQRPAVADELNRLRESLENGIRSAFERFAAQGAEDTIKSEYIDLTLPGYAAGRGLLHPITRLERRLMSIVRPFGFVNAIGPEIESEYFCFDALNIPKHHPARDMQDTFYTSGGMVLRTHTSSVQARAFAKRILPIRAASFGRVYRNETEDTSHQAMFHQFDIVWVDKELTLAHLMGLITHILKALYGKRRKVRFVPKFYPYTEPSIGCQISSDSSLGGSAGWVTVGGAGKIHRKVLEEAKIDPKEYSGFAFGLGTSRLAAEMYGVPNLKSLYHPDLRSLRTLV